MELKETKHSYYCECWENIRHQEFENWTEFKEQEGLDYDFDYNLLFRFDIDLEEDVESEYYNTYTLKLHHALQRHGCEQWHIVIRNIKQEDMEDIEKHLKDAWRHLSKLWEEFKEDK